ncbi:MAG: alpha/beta hydrolase, partial [Candidatus Tectomicrobia bacterium]|nr:alpha/beta hydrolase [Candidatus Tectomicrobia bacterium]
MEHTVSVRDGMFTTRVFVEGEGKPLLFLHGIGGMQGSAPFLEGLARHFQVYAPWHPGYGASEGIDHIDDVIDLAFYYHDLLDALQLENPHIVGHSIGGMIGAEVAALCPHAVDKLILVAPMGLWLDQHPVADFCSITREELTQAIWHDPESPIAKEMTPVPTTPEEELRLNLERAQAFSTSGKFLWPIPDKGLKKRIHRIKASTLLIWGESDRLVPPVYGEEFLKRIKRARLTILK